MAKLWRTLVGQRTREAARYIDPDSVFGFNGIQYVVRPGQSPDAKVEDIDNSFAEYVQEAYKASGPIFAVILARMLLFSEARFCWFEVGDNGEDGRPAGREGLELLENPWPNAGTGELLARAEQDVSLGGNFYAVREQGRLRRLRPDWLTIVLSAPPGEAVDSDVAGYWYHPGRRFPNVTEPEPGDPVYLPDEVMHWSPIPDPDAQYRGMSWLTPVVGEILADKAATRHKQQFFTNGATLGAIISSKENLTTEQFKEWKDNLLESHQGVNNAYKPMFLASPVDTNITTADMRQLDFKVTQGAGETRLCAAGGVPPIIVGLSEGLAERHLLELRHGQAQVRRPLGHPAVEVVRPRRRHSGRPAPAGRSTPGGQHRRHRVPARRRQGRRRDRPDPGVDAGVPAAGRHQVRQRQESCRQRRHVADGVERVPVGAAPAARRAAAARRRPAAARRCAETGRRRASGRARSHLEGRRGRGPAARVLDPRRGAGEVGRLAEALDHPPGSPAQVPAGRRSGTHRSRMVSRRIPFLAWK
jgi:hypothetical protein